MGSERLDLPNGQDHIIGAAFATGGNKPGKPSGVRRRPLSQAFPQQPVIRG
jgi:hypothetical protein